MEQDVRHPVDDRRRGESLAHARERVAHVAKSVGTGHLAYATELNNLALLLLMQGEPESAEGLLREALEVRRVNLGEAHPDYATNLSSLGGILWSRSDFGGAEPLLRKALHIRRTALGETHPKTVVSRMTLDQLIQTRREWEAANPPEATPEPATEPVAAEALAPVAGTGAGADGFVLTTATLARLTDALGDEFRALAGRLGAIGDGMRSTGVVPTDDVRGAWETASERFRLLAEVVREFAADHAFAIDDEAVSSLESIRALLPAFSSAEGERERVEGLHQDAIARLDRVEALTCPSDPGFGPLSLCRETARALKARLASALPRALDPEAERLADGSHPLASLVALATDDGSADDEWARQFEAVEKYFGRPLAVAAARSKVK